MKPPTESLNYLVIHGYIFTENGCYSIDSDEYKQLIADGSIFEMWEEEN